MYNKVVVTLDGSRLAEAVLPHAANLAHAVCSEEVVLLRVVEGGGDSELRRADAYLQHLAARLANARIDDRTIKTCQVPRIEWAVVRASPGKAASSILQFGEDNRADLIMLSTHGRSGIDRWLMGSVAEKVLRGADIPVVLVRADPGGPRPVAVTLRILVPLDGSEAAERVLSYVHVFGRTPAHEVTLLYVEPTTHDRTSPNGAQSPFLNPARRGEVETYLSSIAAELANSGLKARWKIRTGHPGEEIADEVKNQSMDLVVMSSHGRTGLAEWAFGSIADQVLRTSTAPVLLVRTGVAGAVPPHFQGPLVYRCHHCGRRTMQEAFSPLDRCGRCHYHFRACGNCVYFDGLMCVLQLTDAAEVYRGNDCGPFDYRKTPLMLP